MKQRLILTLLFIVTNTYSQEYKRNSFDYEKLKMDTIAVCDDSVLTELTKSFKALDENNSKEAVRIAKAIYIQNTNCPQVFEVYGYSVFRSGEWFEGIEIIENGINKFGKIPELIKRKSEMSLEMAELGTGQKNIDGNSVYRANSIKYDEEQFKTENLKSALNDLEFLIKEYNRNDEIFYAAKIHQLLQNYDKSNAAFNSLLTDEKYKYGALFNIAENLIQEKKYSQAEIELNKLLLELPKEIQVYEKLSELSELNGDKIKSKEFKNKSVFYQNVPELTNLDYSKDNYELLIFFGSNENKADKKIKKLNEIVKSNNQEYTIDVCLMILKLHNNHGNGVEEKATEILEKIGKPSIEKVNSLFQSNVSTCTITNLSDIMAVVKDEKSWELLKSYLPYIATMPTTLLPPNVPEKMIQFDEEKGTIEILKVVKNLLSTELKRENDLDELNGFGQYVYYTPLKSINKNKLKKIAIELNYTDSEYKLLEEKIK